MYSTFYIITYAMSLYICLCATKQHHVRNTNATNAKNYISQWQGSAMHCYDPCWVVHDGHTQRITKHKMLAGRNPKHLAGVQFQVGPAAKKCLSLCQKKMTTSETTQGMIYLALVKISKSPWPVPNFKPAGRGAEQAPKKLSWPSFCSLEIPWVFETIKSQWPTLADFATQSSGPHANSKPKFTIEFIELCFFTCFNLQINLSVVDIHGWSGGASSERNQPSLSASHIWCFQQIVCRNYSTTYTVKGLRMFKHNHSQQFLTNQIHDSWRRLVAAAVPRLFRNWRRAKPRWASDRLFVGTWRRLGRTGGIPKSSTPFVLSKKSVLANQGTTVGSENVAQRSISHPNTTTILRFCSWMRFKPILRHA